VFFFFLNTVEKLPISIHLEGADFDEWSKNSNRIQDKFSSTLCEAFLIPDRSIHITRVENGSVILVAHVLPPYGKNIVDSLNVRGALAEVGYLLAYFFLGTCIGFLFRNQQQDGCDIKNLPTIYFLISLAFGMLTCISSQRLFGVETINKTYERESRNYFHPIQYWLAKSLIDIFRLIFYPLFFLCILYIQIVPRAHFHPILVLCYYFHLSVPVLDNYLRLFSIVPNTLILVVQSLLCYPVFSQVSVHERVSLAQ